MKKKLTRKMVALITCLSVALSLAAPGFAISVSEEQKPVVLQNYSNQEAGTAKQVVRDQKKVLYLETTPEMSYCAQILSDGRVQFSYYMIDEGIIYESPVYSQEQIHSAVNMANKRDNASFDALNAAIQKNVLTFSGMKKHDVKDYSTNDATPLRYPSILNTAIARRYGSDYTQLHVASATYTYGGNSYTMNCKERGSTTVEDDASATFDEGTVMTVVLSWVFSFGWDWGDLLESLIREVADIVEIDGMDVIVSVLELGIYNVVNYRTRQVTAVGDILPSYYSSWERRSCLATGLDAFAFGPEYFTNKYDDYDYPATLLQKGWEFYRDYRL